MKCINTGDSYLCKYPNAAYNLQSFCDSYFANLLQNFALLVLEPRPYSVMLMMI